MPMKNCNDTVGNRNRDLPASSTVPQPTAPPRAPYLKETEENDQELTKKRSFCYFCHVCVDRRIILKIY